MVRQHGLFGNDERFDAARSEQAREEAIRRVEEHAKDAWKRRALHAVIACARCVDEFTTDDVWRSLDGADEETHEPRALGPIMRSAQGCGIAEPTDRYSLSEMVSCHRRPKRIWRSLLRRQER